MVAFRRRALTAGAVAALFVVPACGGGASPTGSATSTTTAIAPTSSTSSTSTSTSTSSTVPLPANCTESRAGVRTCVIEGRPLRRRRRRRRLLLPPGNGLHGDDARAEYASVASFGELALRLMAVGAPAELIARCHRAALDEIRHAETADRLAGRDPVGFGAIPHLRGRRIGGRFRLRRTEIARLAVESYRDGWLNEGAAAVALEERALRAVNSDERDALFRMAADERGHADLARDIVLWCFDEHPSVVGRALAAA